MRAVHVKIALAIAAVGVVGMGSVAFADSGNHDKAHLTGFEETPALSTPGSGDFRFDINKDNTEISYKLTFSDLESDATQAHIHFENRTNAGPVIVFLCSNLGNAPAGTQACPAAGGTITGTLTAADMVNGGAAQGLAAGEFAEFTRAIRAGATYVNVHSTTRPNGEIRAQLDDDHHGSDD